MIKFKRLTIALAALLITSATAWAQTEQTVAVTPVTGQTNQWTLTMPAGNVTLNVEYEPAYTATFKALTANTIQAGKATVKLTDNTEGATAQTKTLDADGKLTPVYEGQTITLTAQQGYKFRSVTAAKKGAATPLDNTTAAWAAGTYEVPAGGLTYSDAITVSGDVTLVLTDGETLTLNKGISIADGATLTIQGNGTMNVNGTSGSTASTVAGTGTLVLTSGTLNVKGGNGGSVGGDHQMDVTANAGGVAINAAVTVNGGTLTATGGNGGSVTGDHLINCKGGAGGAAISGDLTVNGGTMTTTNGNNGSVAAGNANCTAGAGGKAVAGTVTDNRN